MFVGHYGVALLAKGAEPRAPFWVLVLAVQLVDVAWAVLVLLGVERLRLDPTLPSNPLVLDHMPYTHSLLAALVWSGLAFAATRRWLGAAPAAVVAAAVGSHWVLDWVVHRPDLALWPGSVRVGLGLWNQPLLALALELALVVAGASFTVRARSLAGRARSAVLLFAAGLVALQIAFTLGPVPSTVPGMAVSALALFLAVAAAAAVTERRAGQR